MTEQNIISFYESDSYFNEVRIILKQAKKIIDDQEYLQKFALVLDIDETSISHYKFLKAAGFPQEENNSIWQDLISKRDVEVIKPTLDFYLYCLNKGMKVFFISARFSTYLNITKHALQNAGYFYFEDVFVLSEDILIYSSKNFTKFKENRRAYIESLGYKVLISVGDQSSDIEGNYVLNTFQLPNYLYGENSVF